LDPLRRFASILKFTLYVGCLLAVTAIIPLMQEATNRADLAGLTQTCFYATRVGEHRTVSLFDGTKVDLNTNTRIRCAFSNKSRNVEVWGEAHFTVNSADPRPFQVLGGESVTRDLSTSFDVFRKAHSTLITVTGGSVKVAAPIGAEARAKFREAAADGIPWQTAPEIHRLQQVEVFDSTGVLRRHPDLDEDQLVQLLAWSEGWIDLNGRTLNEALADFPRYMPNHEFIVKDTQLRGLKLDGSMKFNQLSDFLAALHREFAVEATIIERSDGVTVVTLSRAKKTVVAR